MAEKVLARAKQGEREKSKIPRKEAAEPEKQKSGGRSRSKSRGRVGDSEEPDPKEEKEEQERRKLGDEYKKLLIRKEEIEDEIEKCLLKFGEFCLKKQLRENEERKESSRYMSYS